MISFQKSKLASTITIVLATIGLSPLVTQATGMSDALLNKIHSDQPHLLMGVDKSKITSNSNSDLVKADIQLPSNQVNGRLIVRLKPNANKSDLLAALSTNGIQNYHVIRSFRTVALNPITIDNVGNTKPAPLTPPIPGLGNTKKPTVPTPNVGNAPQEIVVLQSTQLSTTQFMNVIKALPSVDLVEPDYIVTIDSNTLTPAKPANEGIQAIPYDNLFNQLWGMKNTGQNGGTPGADISAEQAWDVIRTSPNKIVGVIDTGVDYHHNDLKNNIWTNPNEIAGNGIDDDGNGYIDDIHGIDTFNHDSDPLDDNSHGTHVAGTIGAEGGNTLGVAGINWRVKIAACKFLSAWGSGSTSGAIECVNYFTALAQAGHNIVVTNNSWGGGGSSQLLLDSINAGANAGILFVAAAGNSGRDTDTTPHYPSSYQSNSIISVAATDRNDILAGFSNKGKVSVDLAAPGVSILSTFPSTKHCSITGIPRVSQGFESALGPNWQFSAANNFIPYYVNDPTLYWQRDNTDHSSGIFSFSDSINGNYVDNLISSAGEGSFDLSTLTTGCFSFRIKGQNEAFFDRLSVYVSGDNGVSWSMIGSTSTPNYPSWTTLDFLIPPTKLTNQFKYALVRTTDFSVVHSGYQVDDIRISEAHTYYSDNYASISGTSMAAPHVTGAVALAATAFPTETLAQRRARVLNNVDVLPSLTGMVATNGRLNLFKIVQGAVGNNRLPFALGELPITDVFATYSFGSNSGITSPVIIAGPATRHGVDPGVVRIKNIDPVNRTFKLAFKEWNYLDGLHAREFLDFFVTEKGRFKQGNVEMEANTFPLAGTGTYATIPFSSPFPGIPAVFLMAQTSNGAEIVTVRAKNVTANSFDVALYEQESLMNGHTTEIIGYFAIYSPSNSGSFTDYQGTQHSFTTAVRNISSAPITYNGKKYFLEEERSKDAEVSHTSENVRFLSFPRGPVYTFKFTQQESNHGQDTATVREF